MTRLQKKEEICMCIVVRLIMRKEKQKPTHHRVKGASVQILQATATAAIVNLLGKKLQEVPAIRLD
jgi:hypothetical protein